MHRVHHRSRASQARAAFRSRAGDRRFRLKLSSCCANDWRTAMKRRDFLIAAAAAGLAPLAARAQGAYPSKPINWVVGFPPGGGADGVSRLVAAKVSQYIGQPAVV